MGGYETTRFKSKASPTASRLEALHLLLPAAAGANGDVAIKKGSAVASGAMLTRQAGQPRFRLKGVGCRV